MKTYPIQSPQGATVLIYGHENGISLVWRGGKPLKNPKPNSSKGKQNGGSSDDAVMILDSDDETPRKPSKSPSFVDKPEFEDGPTDESSPFPETIQTLDLALGTAALHVTVPPLAPSTAEDAAWTATDILKDRIVLAVACATNDVYVITLPLTPPSHQSKARPELRNDLLAGVAGRGAWGETLTLLGGQNKSSDGIAITLVKQRQAGAERSRSVDRSGPQTPSPARVIVAACAREASGVLRFWDVNLESKPSATRVEPFQTEYLPSPLKGISFNPSHSTQLLTVASPHAVRIYDYSTPSLPEDISDGPFPTQGSWLLSLYPPFSQSLALATSRKPILDAAWISLGRAILTLLADGQWGIWDIDGATASLGSGGKSTGLFGKHSSGLRGAGLTNFSASGYLEGTSALRNPGSQKSPAAPGSGGEFVPMTPHTRRDALASTTGGAERLASVRGGIEVLHAQPLRAASGLTPADESAILWMGGADPIVAVIPGVSRFWDAQLRRGVGGGVNLFSGAQPTRMIRLTDLGAGLLGERCTGVAPIPRPSRQRHGAATSTDTPPIGDKNSAEGLPIDVLVQGEGRLVMVRESEDDTPVTNRLLGSRSKQRPSGRSASAIIAYPRPEKPSSITFNLSVRAGNRHASRQRPPVAGLFDSAPTDVLPSTEVDEDTGLRPRGPARDTGLAFMQSLNVAADVADDEEEAEERNVEEEILDIMEIDRELEEMESDRQSGRKHVFFEEG